MTTIFLDTETTGLPTLVQNKYFPKYYNTKNYDSARLIQISYIIIKNDNILDVSNFCIKHEFTTPDSNYYHVTNDIVSKFGKSLTYVLDNLYNKLKKYNVEFMVCHNIKFDSNIIQSEAYRINNKLLLKKLFQLTNICTCSLTKNYTQIKYKNSNNYKQPKLTELYYKCFNKQYEGEHDSMNDVIAMTKCFYYMINDNKNEHFKNIIPFCFSKINIDIEKKILEFSKQKVNIVYKNNNIEKNYTVDKQLYKKFCSLKNTIINCTEDTLNIFFNFCNYNKYTFTNSNYININDKYFNFITNNQPYIKNITDKKILQYLLDLSLMFDCKLLIYIIKKYNN